ncbi:homeobox domain protein [Ostertagia ostertagi]
MTQSNYIVVKKYGKPGQFKNESKRGKELGAVEKYRLRRKYPPPRSIYWTDKNYTYSCKENSRRFDITIARPSSDLTLTLKNQYPTLDQKKEISRATDLEIVQISNWFKNRRQRDKTRMECAHNTVDRKWFNCRHSLTVISL